MDELGARNTWDGPDNAPVERRRLLAWALKVGLIAGLYNQTELARALGVSRKTLSRYAKEFAEALGEQDFSGEAFRSLSPSAQVDLVALVHAHWEALSGAGEGLNRDISEFVRRLRAGALGREVPGVALARTSGGYSSASRERLRTKGRHFRQQLYGRASKPAVDVDYAPPQRSSLLDQRVVGIEDVVRLATQAESFYLMRRPGLLAQLHNGLATLQRLGPGSVSLDGEATILVYTIKLWREAEFGGVRWAFERLRNLVQNDYDPRVVMNVGSVVISLRDHNYPAAAEAWIDTGIRLLKKCELPTDSKAREQADLLLHRADPQLAAALGGGHNGPWQANDALNKARRLIDDHGLAEMQVQLVRRELGLAMLDAQGDVRRLRQPKVEGTLSDLYELALDAEQKGRMSSWPVSGWLAGASAFAALGDDGSMRKFLTRFDALVTSNPWYENQLRHRRQLVNALQQAEGRARVYVGDLETRAPEERGLDYWGLVERLPSPESYTPAKFPFLRN